MCGPRTSPERQREHLRQSARRNQFKSLLQWMLEKNPEDQGLLFAALQAEQLELGAIDDHLVMPEMPMMESNPRGVVDYYSKLISLVLY
jgi:hypothetical protein